MPHHHHHIQKLHARLIKTGHHNDHLSLRPLLLSCATLSLSYARSLLYSIPSPDAFAWNTLIRAHANATTTKADSPPSNALNLFVEMRQRGVSPDHYTFPFALKACARLAFLQTGKAIHSQAVTLGFDSDIFVQNTLIHLYGNCGLVESACQVFDEMPHRDLVSWSATIACFANNGLGEEALAAFREMQVATSLRPDEVMMVSVVSAVSTLGALELGRWVDFYVRRSAFDITVSMGTALIVMYSKCGCIGSAVKVFREMPERNELTWTALINGFALHGQSKEALRTFYEMKQSGFRPDYVTFIGVLSACSHGGLLEQGWQLFNSIRRDYGIDPGLEHYGCMVDLLGRAGLLNECYDFIERMQIAPNSIIWRTLLGACANYSNVKLAEHVKRRISELDPHHDGDYVLLSNAYGGLGRWVEKAGVRCSMQERGIGKRPGCSLIEVDRVIHEFVAGDESHPQSKEINEMLGLILEQLRSVGYAPDTSNVLFDIEEEEKERALSYHSEKLAVAFALLSSHHGRTIRVVKNLRICHDCHIFMKLVSGIFHREIIVRDRNRFHHFREGFCSCGDYW
ncbi:pentatricopeptide repeat-containing protein At5g48910-like [Magnolia sinica]|uniref:pentatricopeptide repeat-containing protein At5g48910-like n=1 Tax=Magnolia sinica TaxID=86752 RepID=UPI002659A894|nr:pentatricopeptide repeat-containing protein At5g48910-like [Magnolia sinica]